MAYFVMMKDQAGRRLLVNLDAVIGIGEDDKGMALPYSMSGAPIQTGLAFDIVMRDLLQPEGAPG